MCGRENSKLSAIISLCLRNGTRETVSMRSISLTAVAELLVLYKYMLMYDKYIGQYTGKKM